MKYEKRYKKYKQLLCLFLSFVLLWGILPIEAVFAVEEETVQETEAEQSGEQETDDVGLETAETETEAETEAETVAYTTYTNSISGMLWVDMYENTANSIRSGDGIRQEGETALSGYTVSLYKAEDKVHAVANTTTGADGKYEFTDLEPGSYVVGVASGTMNGTEYLLPIVGITGDNKFGTWSVDYTRKYSDTIVIGADSIAAGIDAGMRTPPGVQPMWAGPIYSLTGDVSGLIRDEWGNEYHSDLSTVATCINNYYTDTKFTITVMGDDTGSGRFEISRSGVEIIIISSDTSVSRTITVAEWVGWDGKFFDFTGSGNTLTLNNIILDGSNIVNRSEEGGYVISTVGINMLMSTQNSPNTLIMKKGSAVKNFSYNEWNSGGVRLGDYSTLIMSEGSEISGNMSGGFGGGVYLGSNSTFTMYGGKINNNKAEGNGKGVYLGSDSIFTMEGGEISNNLPTSTTEWGDGGGVYLSGRSKFKMTAGTISNNTAVNIGGGVYLTDSEFEMNGGEIISNTAVSGGGVYIKNSTFTMIGGQIGTKNNSNRAVDGGGVLLVKSIFNMTGGSISYNIVQLDGGGISAVGDSTFTLDENGVISNNMATSGGGVYVEESHLIVRDGTIGGSKGEGNTAINGGGVYLAGGSAFEMTNGKISGNNAIDNGGGVNVNSGITDGSDNTTYFPSTFTMSGGTIGGDNQSEGNTANDGGGVFIAPGCSFIDASTDSIEVKIAFNKATYAGGGIYVRYNKGIDLLVGKFKMQNLVISYNEAEENYGGGILFMVESIADGGGLPITMAGGLIEDNTAAFGGGIGLINNSDKHLTCTIAEVKIDENRTTGYGNDDGHGGGVNVIADTDAEIELTMKNCKISNNVTSNDNIAGRDNYTLGGGIYCGTNSSLIMTGGSIEKNTAASGGGGAYFTSSTPVKIALNNVTISGNKGWEGGGLRIDANTTDDSKIFNCTISNNRASNKGGGIFLDGLGTPSTMTIEKTKITENHANPYGWDEKRGVGGGVYISNNNILVMNDGEISSNDANGEGNLDGGGGVYVDETATFTINSGTITNNEAINGDGGGIYVRDDGYVNVQGTLIVAETDKVSITISDNTANRDGGGIYTGAAGWNPEDYENLFVNEYVKFTGNVATEKYNPLNAKVLPFSKYWGTITNYTYTTAVDPIYAENNRLVAVNNYDINYDPIIGSITIIKKGTTGPLGGAEFKVERLDSSGNVIDGSVKTGITSDTSDEGTGTVKGTVKFSDLEPGEYRITETKAPPGYFLLAKSFTVTIPVASDAMPETGYEGAYQYMDGNYYYFDPVFTVTDQEAFTLPAAGSAGFLSRYYLWIGLTILLGAGGSHVYRQRRGRSCG